MLKLDMFRRFVDQRLTAATDDIFRRFARTIAEYEREVFRLKQEIDRHRRLLEAAEGPADRPADGPDRPADRPDGPDGPDRPADGPDRPADGPDRPAGVLQLFTTEEEQQVSGRSFSLHIKQEEDGASGPQEANTKFAHSPDWLIESYKDEGSPSTNPIQSHREEEFFPAPSDLLIRPEPRGNCKPSDLKRDSVIESESSTEDSDDAQLEPGLQRTLGTRTWPPADQKLLVCSSCGREFSSKRTLRKHIRQNISQDPDQMSCSLRRQRAPFQSPAKSFSCRVCGSSFYTQGILVRHAENHCKEPESRCGACGDLLESTETLRDHLRSHKEQGSTCDVCGKKCSSIRRMEIHKRVHTGEKPYRCGFCSRDFSRKESLERHLKVHSGDRPHHCRLCRRTFTRREYLVHHLKTGHTERPVLT